MANEQLESFLASESAPAPAPEPATPAAPEAPPAASAPKPEAKPDPGAKAAAAKPEPEDDGEPPEPLEGEPVIPRRAYEDERRKRQDWKARAVEAETKHKELMRQLEDAQRRATAPPPQPQAPPQPPPDPAVDPRGFAQHLVQQQQQALLNERLNNSEMLLREKIGDEKLSEYVNEFRSMAEADPTLFGKLYSQPHPYNWLTREVDRLRLVRDVGDDPAAFRSKIEAEARARWEAEAKAQPAPVSPAAGMQPSLATARSVAGRSAGAWTGEPSLEDVLAPVQNRRRPNGQGGSVRY
jgi:hypothetical protein